MSQIVILSHPTFSLSQSMPRFQNLLQTGMERKGYIVQVWRPASFFFNLPVSQGLKKWLGYIDQFVVFPQQVRRRLKQTSRDTLFVFVDQALGPWVPLIVNRPHIIHCHDFLAQQSAFSYNPNNLTGWSGKIYQRFIRKGYTKGKHFVSVSYKTQSDLHELLLKAPLLSEVVYNGMNKSLLKFSIPEARQIIHRRVSTDLSNGYILHVGGNQWYKNRQGVFMIYEAWRKLNRGRLPLLLVGAAPTTPLRQAFEQSKYKDDIHFCTGFSDDEVQAAYTAATVLLFPSLAEGFGWPIAEAMSLGCPVITTDSAPMTEVAGNAALLLPKRPTAEQQESWLSEGARLVEHVVNMSEKERQTLIDRGIENAQRFNTSDAIDKIEAVYLKVLSNYEGS